MTVRIVSPRLIFKLGARKVEIFAENTGSASISAQTELRPTNEFCPSFERRDFLVGRLRPNRTGGLDLMPGVVYLRRLSRPSQVSSRAIVN
jgi:hypothetical protein